MEAKSWRNKSIAWRNREQWKKEPLWRAAPALTPPVFLDLRLEMSRTGCGELGEQGPSTSVPNREDVRLSSTRLWPHTEVSIFQPPVPLVPISMLVSPWHSELLASSRVFLGSGPCTPWHSKEQDLPSLCLTSLTFLNSAFPTIFFLQNSRLGSFKTWAVLSDKPSIV